MNKKIVRTLREEIEALALRLRFVRDLNVEALDLQNMQQELNRILARHPAKPVEPPPEASTPNEPEVLDMGNGDHWQDAIDAALDARAAAADALTRAITTQAHFELCAIITNQTATLQRLELARKADAS